MPIPSDTERTHSAVLDALADAALRVEASPIAYLPDGPRDLPSIEARAAAMQIAHGPRPLSFGPQRMVSIAPTPESTDAPPSKSDLANT